MTPRPHAEPARQPARRSAWLFGLAGAATAVIGRTITADGAVPWSSAWPYLAIAALTPLFGLVAAAARRLVERPRRRPLAVWANRRRTFWLEWAAIWLAWTPVWLSGWPGFWCYDATSAYLDAKGGRLTTALPPLHTHLATGLQAAVARWTGADNYGIAAFILVQSLAVAGVFAYTLRRLRAWGAPQSARWGALAYYGLFPTVALFSLSWVRNTAFSAVLLALAVCLVDALRARSRGGPRWWLVGLLAVAAITLRRDAIYVFVAFTAIVLAGRRPARKAMALCFAAASAAGLLIDPLIYKGLMGLPAGTTAAAYSLPLQQLARVRANPPPDSLTRDQERRLESFVKPKALDRYRPQLADPVIVGADMRRIKRDRLGFVRLWAEVGREHPAAYADAALAATVQGWLPGAVIDAYAYPGTEHAYPPTGTCYFCYAAERPGVAESKGPRFIHGFYAAFSYKSRFHFELPVLGWLFSPGAHLWGFAFGLAVAAAGTRRGRPSAFAPVALLVLTSCLPIFLGPAMLVRYFLQLFY
ncbi:MAG: DUF6020 family protein, partial [Bifidobacteriaceae bacterium]|nr:DUF6020 family protein [Bifidobacteriaceae bacterium]